MAQIRIDTERARDVGRQFLGEGNRLAEIGRELQRAISSLDTWAWDGRSRRRAEPLLGRVRPESERVADELDMLGRKLVRVADTFEQEDNTAARNLEGMPWVDFGAGGLTHGVGTSGSGLDIPDLISDAAGTFDYSKDAAEVLASVWLAGGLVSGTTYLGQSIFRGGHRLKNLAGVNPYLTHIKDVNIPSHMAKTAFRSKFGRGNILLEGLTEVGENWKEYGGDVPKVATGIVVDTFLGIGGAAIGAGVGTIVFGTVGGLLLGPAGAVIGGKIGGVVGSVAGGWVAEKVEDIKIGDQELDQAVVETVTGGIEASAQAIDRALDSFVSSVARLF
jgi:WXG100 family type VII secretion target